MRRSTIGLILALALGILTAPLTAVAQPSTKVPRIGYLGGLSLSSAAPYVEAFRQGLRDLGYVEGRNLVIEYRWAEGRLERLPDLAAELVHLPVDIIVTTGLGIGAAQRATKTIPIVMTASPDAVAGGLVTSLARPGGNLTGLTFMASDLMEKRLQLFREAVPHLSRLAFLTSPGGTMRAVVNATEAAAHALGLQLHILEVGTPDDLQSVFTAIVKERADALYILESQVLSVPETVRQIQDFAAKHRLPTMFGVGQYVDAGGLMSYGVDFRDSWRRAATYVDKILKGAKPADLPVEQPIKFVLVINLKTARALGLTIPPTVLFQADEVIQ